MAPHRNIPSAGNTPSIKQPVKPERTLRSHEENQERAYIAASRRSDRSLEARVESARRASDIHKKRTGRALRVTEQDVMNEEMYEEEDDDMPWRYRNVTAHLPLEDGLLSRRIQSMLAVQLENQRLLGQAVNSTLQHNPQFQQQAQFVSPGMMSMSQFGYQNSMMPPQQQLNRISSMYGNQPYPQQQQQQPAAHRRSASIASPQDLTSMQHFQQPTPNVNADGRRMSSPTNSMHTQVYPHPNALSNRSASYQSTHVSTPNTPVHHDTPASPQQRSHQQRGPSTSHNNFGASQQQEADSPFAPLTISLPMDTQQLLAGAQNFPTFDLFGSQEPMKPQQQQPFYSYKPNTGSGAMKGYQPSSTAGLDQTLLGTALDTNLSNKADSAFSDTPTAADSTALYSAMGDSSYGYGFDGSSMFNFDSQTIGSGLNTPGNLSSYNEPIYNDFLESEMFGDGQAGATG